MLVVAYEIQSLNGVVDLLKHDHVSQQRRNQSNVDPHDVVSDRSSCVSKVAVDEPKHRELQEL